MSTDLQQQLFQAIKSKQPQHISLVDEVAATLDISTDSAYRRVRGEKSLSLEEVATLCTKYALSLDSLLHLQSDGFLFRGEFFMPEEFRYKNYIANYERNMKNISSFQNRKIFFLCKDIPPHHYFGVREIAAFKHFFWMRTFINAPEFLTKKFAIADYPDELFELGKSALHYYNQCDSVELWSMETVNNMLHQIEYYVAMNLFAHEEEIRIIYNRLEQLVLHIEKQADAGSKFDIEDASKKSLSSFQLYYNEVILGDNSVMVTVNDTKMVFIAHNIFNFMATTDVRFCENTYKNVQNLMKKSTLISNVSERERAQFFHYLRSRIAAGTQMGS